MPTGKKTGGRKPGSRNKRTLALAGLADPLYAESDELLDQILKGKLPCGVCHGKGKTRFQPRRKKVAGIWEDVDVQEAAKLGERTCQSCYGSGLERLSPELRARVALDLREYAHAKKKAVEMTNPDGNMRPAWVVRIAGSDKPDDKPEGEE